MRKPSVLARVPVVFGIAVLVGAGAVAPASGLGRAAESVVGSTTTRVHRVWGDALTAPSRGTAVDVVRSYLADRGRSAATLASLRLVSSARSRRAPVSYVRFEQRVRGLRVHDTYVKAAVDSTGRLLDLIENIVDVSDVRSARVDAAAALRAAKQAVGATRAGFVRPPAVEAVAASTSYGRLAAAYLVETWTAADNALNETLVGGDGAVVSVTSRHASDSYNVFTEDPSKAPQQVVQGPGGWLVGTTQSTTNINGENARAYLDVVSDNKPDAGGSAVTDGNFLTPVNLTEQPSTSGNQAVAVQNLFYLNNVIHDYLKTAGFDEAAGNFELTNPPGVRGGGDPVLAEAQDGGGTDNANFATPRDGRSPRMQMYLWTGTGTHQVVSSVGTMAAGGAAFGPALDQTGLSGALALANDGVEPAGDACTAVNNSLAGSIAIVDRGTCPFVDKVRNAQNAGATGVIVVNNVGDGVMGMGGDDPAITIPSVFVGQNDGAVLKSATGTSATIREAVPAPLMVDGDLDADIVYHEYGHGLTWRMIGGMSGPMSAAVGEGMSDIVAMLVNGDDVIGEYSASDPLGIRRDRYASYPRTYAEFTGAEVHDDGEIYAAIGWRLIELYNANGISISTLAADLVDGMNYTPSGPAFEDMRDGILASLQNAGGAARQCLVWNAFAQFGVGVGAASRVNKRGATITESFALPAGC